MKPVVSQPGAIVVGGDYQGLAVARSLGSRNIPVIVVDDELSISRYSRHVTDFVRSGPLVSEEQTVTALMELSTSHDVDGWVVYPTREETVVAVARNRAQLDTRYRIPTPPWEVTQWGWDKRNTYRRATELGIPVPRTWLVSSEDQLDVVDGEPPFVIKPAIKEHFFYATGKKAWRANSRDELVRRFRDAATLIGPQEVMVQELIPGGGGEQFAYCSFFKDGRPLASMTVQRLRQHPPDFGRASTFVRTLDTRDLDEPSETFLRAIGYYGLAELEYKRDPRDGLTKLLDVNLRTSGYHSLGRRAGVDFAYLLYADQVGLQLTAAGRARAGVSWVRLVTDAPMAARELAGRRLKLRPYLRSLREADTEAVFSGDDIRPWLAEIVLLPYLAVKRGI